jgi:N-acetylmuramoyl-L-alanine amidase
MPIHIVSDGESIPSIAKDYGFFWQTIWNHPQNAELKEKRKNPNVLLEGDEVFIPEKQEKQESRGTEQKHRFLRKGDPAKIKLRLTMMDQPRANEDYILDIDGKLIQGKTDADGQLEAIIPPNARSGRLILQGGKEEYPLMIGNLDPVDEPSGIQQRLNNLGFDCGGEEGEIGEKTREAIKRFQEAYNLEATGEPDEATRNKLLELHQ